MTSPSLQPPADAAHRPSPRERAALDRLVERHAPFVRRYLRVLGAGADADDLQQETFVALLSRPFDDRGDGPTRAFLRLTARNLFLRHGDQLTGARARSPGDE